jgi:DNA replication and repair protein RecF
MHVLQMSCDAFRCLKQVEFEPAKGINVIRGSNAQGKTSLLEAILFATTSKSHRTTTEKELVAHNQQGFRIRLSVHRSPSAVSLEANWWEGAKRFKVNGVSQTRVSDILGRVNVVLITPEDIALVKGAASGRRNFLDMTLSQLNTRYLQALQQYRQALRQRNELLRKGIDSEDLIDLWNEQLVRHGSVIMKERASFVQELAAHAASIYEDIAQREPFAVDYRPDIRDDESFLTILKRSLGADLRHRSTTRGPHRDDIELLIDGQPARKCASQGQQKTAALALKLAELRLLAERIGECPVLLLDEVFAELDTERARRVFTAIEGADQCLLTTTNPEIASRHDCNHFVAHEGRLAKA